MEFSGGARDITADDFLFRVEDMAISGNVNFDDMCRSFHMLLASRAEEWFWGYRRKQQQISWQHFKTAFLKKFATRDTDEEIMSTMSQRKQQLGERFDDFCRAVESMSFRLQINLPESNMVSLLKSNADHHLRDVLNMHNISSVDMLQEIATKYEDLWIKQGVWRRSTRSVNEIDSVEAILNRTPAELVCWNCDTVGHCYQDCEVATRNVFCYGCGAKNVYRPQCPRCTLNSKRSGINGPIYSGNLFSSGPKIQPTLPTQTLQTIPHHIYQSTSFLSPQLTAQ